MADELPLRRAVVTGATGFVGSRLVPSLLKSGVEVVACSRVPPDTPGVRWVQLNLPHLPPRKALAGADVVFHLAGRAHSSATSKGDDRLHDEVNAQGTTAVARAAAAGGVRRFVLVSSVKAMRPPGHERVLESDPGLPIDSYGLSKRRAEAGALSAADGSDMDVVILRPALVYGPGVKGNLASLLDIVTRGRRLPLPDVPNRRSLLGLSDLVAAARLCAVHPYAAGRTYVVTDGQTYSTRRIIDALARGAGLDASSRFIFPLPLLTLAAKCGDQMTRMAGRRVPFDSEVLEKLVGNAEYECELIRTEIGFCAAVELEDQSHEMATAHRSTRGRSGQRSASSNTDLALGAPPE